MFGKRSQIRLGPSYFMGATVSTDWRVGSLITFSGEWQGKAFEDKGEILAAEPQHRLSFSRWSPMSGTEDIDDNYHVVEIELADENEDTTVLLSQSNLVGGVTESDRANQDEYDKNWNSVLEGMKRTIER